MSEVMQMRTTAASIHELLGAALLRRVTCAGVIEVHYEEHTPEPWTGGLAPSSGVGGGRATPPPPPRARGPRFDATVRSLVTPAATNPEPSDGQTQPIWQPTAAALAQLQAEAAPTPSYVAELLASEPGYVPPSSLGNGPRAAYGAGQSEVQSGYVAPPPSFGTATGYPAPPSYGNSYAPNTASGYAASSFGETQAGYAPAPSYADAEAGYGVPPSHGDAASGYAAAPNAAHAYGVPPSYADAASFGYGPNGGNGSAGYAAPGFAAAPSSDGNFAAPGYPAPPPSFIAPAPGFAAAPGFGVPASGTVPPGFAAAPPSAGSVAAPGFPTAPPNFGAAPGFPSAPPNFGAASGVPTFGSAAPDAEAYAPPAEWFDESQVDDADGPPRLEIPPPRIPDFALGEALLPERAHDPHYYPGISDEPPEPEPERRSWRRPAIIGGAAALIFAAGALTRGVSGGSAPEGRAIIDVTPLDAQVTLDGEVLAGNSSPHTRDGLVHGEHVIQAERRGFLSQRRVFTLSKGEAERRVVITLEAEPVVPPPAAATPPPAAEPTPTIQQPMAAAEPTPEPEPSHEHLSAKELAKQRRAERVAERYRARKAGDSDRSSAKEAKAASRAEAKAAREAKLAARAEVKAAKADGAPAKAGKDATALLKLNSTPWSEVYVDNKHVGHTPVLGLPLPAGSHTIRLVNPTIGGNKTIKIRLKAGQTLTKVVQL